MKIRTLFFVLIALVMVGCRGGSQEIQKEPAGHNSTKACFTGIVCPSSSTYSIINAVSADGTTVVGSCNSSSHSSQAFRWDILTGMHMIPEMKQAVDVSGDGTVIVGRDEEHHSLIWTLEGGTMHHNEWRGTLWPTETSISSINNSGAVVAGIYHTDDVRVTNKKGFLDLGKTGNVFLWWWLGPDFYDDPDDPVAAHRKLVNHVPAALSADGRIITGTAIGTFNGSGRKFSEFFITKLNPNGIPRNTIYPDITAPHPHKVPTGFPGLPGPSGIDSWEILEDYSSEAADISNDGNVVVGTRLMGNNFTNAIAFRWTKETGVRLLGSIPGSGVPSSWANATNASGNIIVGTSKGEAFIVSETLEFPRSLRDYLMTQYGLDTELQYFDLITARDISDNGKIIVGDGIKKILRGTIWRGKLMAWVVVLPSRNFRKKLLDERKDDISSVKDSRFIKCLIGQ